MEPFVNKNEVNTKDIILDCNPSTERERETIIITKVTIDKQLDLSKRQQIDVIYINLYYQSKYKYEWEIRKDLKLYMQYTLIMQKGINQMPFKPPSSTFLHNLEKVSSCRIDEMKKYENEIKNILNDWTHDSRFKDDAWWKQFLEVSNHSFLESNQGKKPKERLIQVKGPYNSCQWSCLGLFKCLKGACYRPWTDCWFWLKDDMICYLTSPVSNEGKGTLWFNEHSDVFIMNNHWVIMNNIKKLTLKFDHEFFMKEWLMIIRNKISNFKEKNPNQYGSFVDSKSNCRGKWFVDGHNYFTDLQMSLLKAKSSVFITDWWLSPEIFLKRPVEYKKYAKLQGGLIPENEKEANEWSRLCDILNYIANRGVKVFILIYCEMEMAWTWNSKHTKTFLQNINPNINVCRHPKTAFDLLWSHHEKLVVIDQSIAYVGGLDLCWGRYDTQRHWLSDDENSKGEFVFPGIDYSNPRIADFVNVENYWKEGYDRWQPRMPWHDVHSKFEGPAVLDVARHFIERWNYSKSTNKKAITDIKTHVNTNTEWDNQNAQCNKVNDTQDNKSQGKNEKTPLRISILDNRELRQICTNTPFNKNISHKFNLEMNTIEEDVKKEDATTKRRDWERIATLVDGIQDEESNFHVVGNFTTKAVKKEIQYKWASSLRQKSAWGNIQKKPTKNKQSSPKTVELQTNLKSWNWNINSTEPKLTIQCLRSLGEWSSGLRITEKSIWTAYLDLIDNAEHYIYIENQFFVSKAFTDDEWTRNGKTTSNWIVNTIAYHLRKRIEKAYENKEKFKVIVFIPLVPAFAGEVSTSSTLQVILKYTYKTISRNDGLSLMELLKESLGDAYTDYISFYSLRTHEVINSIPKTELIYIHSKWMIIDDKFVIMGSANINDRSMLGDRDSEFAVIYKEENLISTTYGGQPGKCSNFARSLRMELWAEHLGVDPNNNALWCDPINEEWLNLFKSRAKLNTDSYEKIFNCYPNDKFKQFSEIPKPPEQTEEYFNDWKEKYNQYKTDIVGHIIEFPWLFLENQIWERSFFSAEMLVPIKNFV